MNRIWLLLLLFTAHFSLLRAGSSFVFVNDTTRLFWVQNNEVYSPDGSLLLYFQKGNIFFHGTADERESIYIMASSMNPEGEKMNYLFEGTGTTASFSFSKSTFYLGKPETEEDLFRSELLHVQRAGKWLAFYSSLNDSLLGYYIYDSLPPSMTVFVAYTLIRKYNLDKKAEQTKRVAPFVTPAYSTIRPIWGNPTDNEWIWDGQILRLRWNVDPRYQWTFDGQTIKPFYSGNIYAEYTWDGESLKPMWRTDRTREWMWDGNLMKPIWDTDWANQYKIENGIVKPWSNVHSEREWRIDGDIPLPLIILVVSGLARY